MTPERRARAERAIADAPELTEEQVRKIALLLAPTLRKVQEGEPA